MSSLLHAIPPIATFLLSTHALLLSTTNIQNLQKYERQSEKAAEWSATAAQRLAKTRKTQAAGVVALLFSLLSSLYLLYATLISANNAGIGGVWYIYALNAFLLLTAQKYMQGFWNEEEQTRVPFLQGFNDAVRGSERVVRVLGWVAGVWGLGIGVWVLVG